MHSVNSNATVGVYRIVYELRDDKTVRVVAIRHRGSAYVTDAR
jgi:mRNA interferase RelE/StbE